MFQFLKKEKSAPALLESLSLFGKLPGIADYTRVNAHLEHAVMINAEIERMIAGLHEQCSASIHSLDMQCVFEQEGRWLVTQVCHSTDKSGRAYPFTGVGFVSHPLMKECQPAVPAILSPFYEYVSALKEGITSKADLEMALKKADQLRFAHTKASLLEDEISLLKQMSQSAWLSEAFPGQSKQAIADQILSIGRSIHAYKKGEFEQLTFALSPANTLVSMTLWLQWIESLLQPKRWPLHYCMVSTATYAQLHVWLKPLNHYQFLEWVNPVVLPVNRACASPDFVAILSKDELSLCEAMYRWQQEVVRAIA
ncbi:MAG: hypothetical protein ACHQAX_04660 [Gammaproteobacteria bacterium]